MNEETYARVMLTLAQGFELVAAAVLVLGLVLALIVSARRYLQTRSGSASYRVLRQTFGGVILLGLELFDCVSWESSIIFIISSISFSILSKRVSDSRTVGKETMGE